jgi:hypothetical protein
LFGAGLPDTGVAAIMGNVRPESAWNPSMRVPDQPRYGGEAHFAHGLFQEGGEEWNNYVAWMKKRGLSDWTNPQSQTDFLIERLRTAPQYAQLWQILNDPTVSAEEKAKWFQGGRGWGYLRPGIPHTRQSIEETRAILRDLPNIHKRFDEQEKKSSTTSKVEGNARLTIDLNGFPKGTRTGYATWGDLFGDVQLNRGNAAPDIAQ